MADYAWVTTRLATGAALETAADVTELATAGITAIIDCRIEFNDAQLLTTAGMAYLWDGTSDDGQPKAPEWFQPGIEFALTALSRPRTRLYTHCAAGVNRGPSMAYAVLRAQGWPPGLAEQQVRAARPMAALAYKDDADRAVAALGYT